MSDQIEQESDTQSTECLADDELSKDRESLSSDNGLSDQLNWSADGAEAQTSDTSLVEGK